MTDQLQMIGDMIRMLWRRKFLFLFIVILGSAGSIYLALQQTKLYEARAVIQIQRPQVASALNSPSGEVSVAERVQQIEQRILARSNLAQMIEELNLFTEDEDTSTTEKVTLMREAVRIDRIAAPGTGYGENSIPSALVISVTLGDAELAATATNRFVESVLEQTAEGRRDRARNTLQFLQEEEASISAEIVDLEKRLAEFKNKNLNALPETLSSLQDEISSLRTAVLDIDSRILALEQQRTDLSAGNAGAVGSERGTRSPEYEELRALEIELSERRTVLAANHPEIRSLERQIAALVSGSAKLRDNAIQLQIQRLDRQIASLEAQKKKHTDRQSEIESTIREVPRVSLELNALESTLERRQEQLSAVTRDLSAAETRQRLEDEQQSERFEVLESALVPETSVGPSRKKLALFGFVASCGLAFGLIFLLDLLNPVIRTASQMKRRLDLQPVISIPYIPTAWERRRRRLVWVTALAGIVLGTPFAVDAVDEHVMPIEDIAAMTGVPVIMNMVAHTAEPGGEG